LQHYQSSATLVAFKRYNDQPLLSTRPCFYSLRSNARHEPNIHNLRATGAHAGAFLHRTQPQSKLSRVGASTRKNAQRAANIGAPGQN